MNYRVGVDTGGTFTDCVVIDEQGGIHTFNANDITPSSYVGLTPQLLAFDPRTNGGFTSGSLAVASGIGEKAE